MTMQERQEIFAKEYLSNEDLCKLYDLLPPHASELMNDIKKNLVIGKNRELRLNMRGKLHTQDYLDWIGAPTAGRYGMAVEN